MNFFHYESKYKIKKMWGGGGVDGLTDEQAQNQFAPSTSSKLEA